VITVQTRWAFVRFRTTIPHTGPDPRLGDG
jgi:hypothetical protein